MNDNTISREMLEFLIGRLIENAYESVSECVLTDDDFYKGKRLAYYEMLDTLKSELIVRDQDLDSYGLNMNLEREFA